MIIRWSIPALGLFILFIFPLPIAQLSAATEQEPALLQQPTVDPTQPPNNSELSIPVLEQAVYKQVNQYRSSKGLPPLKLDLRLSAQAREHSQSMAQKQIPFGHADFRARVRRIDRLIPSRRISENVAYIFTHKETAKRAVDGWLRSPHHRPSIEGDYSLTGVGVAQGERGAFYFTQLYVRTR